MDNKPVYGKLEISEQGLSEWNNLENISDMTVKPLHIGADHCLTSTKGELRMKIERVSELTGIPATLTNTKK